MILTIHITYGILANLLETGSIHEITGNTVKAPTPDTANTTSRLIYSNTVCLEWNRIHMYRYTKILLTSEYSSMLHYMVLACQRIMIKWTTPNKSGKTNYILIKHKIFIT